MSQRQRRRTTKRFGRVVNNGEETPLNFKTMIEKSPCKKIFTNFNIRITMATLTKKDLLEALGEFLDKIDEYFGLKDLSAEVVAVIDIKDKKDEDVQE